MAMGAHFYSDNVKDQNSVLRTPQNFTKNTIIMPQFWPGDVKIASRPCQTQYYEKPRTFLCHNFGQRMSIRSQAMLNSGWPRKEDPPILVFLHPGIFSEGQWWQLDPEQLQAAGKFLATVAAISSRPDYSSDCLDGNFLPLCPGLVASSLEIP